MQSSRPRQLPRKQAVKKSKHRSVHAIVHATQAKHGKLCVGGATLGRSCRHGSYVTGAIEHVAARMSLAELRIAWRSSWLQANISLHTAWFI